MKPITKLYFISKFHPGVGLEPIEPLSLGYTFFQAFCEYESSGDVTQEQLAREIIIAFFKKDFPSGRHWQIQKEPECEKIVLRTTGNKDNAGTAARTTASGGGTAYRVSMSATYDWDDTYRVANATGVVKFRTAQKEIRVENYRYVSEVLCVWCDCHDSTFLTYLPPSSYDLTGDP
jgi:hypothetical protein